MAPKQVSTRTMGIAERCNLKIEKVKNPFPKFDVPDGHTIDSYFEYVCREGFKKRMNLLLELQRMGRLRNSFARIRGASQSGDRHHQADAVLRDTS